MNLQTSHNKISNLNIFLNSKELESFFSEPSEKKENSFIYFARYGKSFDGHQYALEVIESKNYIVAESSRIKSLFSLEEQKKILNSSFYIETKNVELAIKDEFKKISILNNLNFFSIGVTGTSGKTSSVQITGKILAQFLKNKILKIGTLGVEIGDRILSNSHVTTPDYPAFINALHLSKEEDIKTLIMEVSSHGLEESRLYDYKFDIGIFTNFSQDHLDFHKTMENYLKAKTLLFRNHLKENSTCIISTQSPEWSQIADSAIGAERVLYLTFDNKFPEIESLKTKFKKIYLVKIDEKKSTLEGLSGTLQLFNADKNLLSNNIFFSPLIGEVNFENIMTAYCVCHAAGYKTNEFTKELSHITNISGRMQKVPNKNQKIQKPTVIVDYSHKPGALQSVIQTLKNLCSNEQKLITVFGCGGDRDSQKRPIMGKIASEFSDYVIITSDNPRTEDPQKIIEQITSGIINKNNIFIEPDRKLAIEKSFKIANKSDIILIAGKGDETYQIIGTQKYNFSDILVADFFLNGD